METEQIKLEKEQQYFIIWLYISILLHILVVIIMLTIKPSITDNTKEPDPASNGLQDTQILFMQEPAVKEDDYKLATREQGGAVLQDMPIKIDTAQEKPAEFDVPEVALSDAYKKDIKNKTVEKEQSPEGIVNIPANAEVANENEDTKQPSTLPKAAEILKTVIEQKIAQKSIVSMPENKDVQEKIENAKETAQAIQAQVQKVVSKKHRPADVGDENLSKIQLTKEKSQLQQPAKKKISLMDLQQGFSNFLKNGNEAYFSAQGNAQEDDMQGLKRASYNRQLGQMYQSAHNMAQAPIYNLQQEQPTGNSIVMITIERSGKISDCTILQSCGINSIDRHHIKVIESIGSFPPIPKYIQAPLQVTATLYFHGDRSFSTGFAPTIIKR
ncbi:MAG: hypothetical protein ACXWL5_02465 [Candidatus Chromulinivorax sp.]